MLQETRFPDSSHFQLHQLLIDCLTWIILPHSLNADCHYPWSSTILLPFSWQRFHKLSQVNHVEDNAHVEVILLMIIIAVSLYEMADHGFPQLPILCSSKASPVLLLSLLATALPVIRVRHAFDGFFSTRLASCISLQ